MVVDSCVLHLTTCVRIENIVKNVSIVIAECWECLLVEKGFGQPWCEAHVRVGGCTLLANGLGYAVWHEYFLCLLAMLPIPSFYLWQGFSTYLFDSFFLIPSISLPSIHILHTHTTLTSPLPQTSDQFIFDTSTIFTHKLHVGILQLSTENIHQDFT